MGSKTHTTTEKLWDELQNASQYNLPDDYEVDGQLSMFDNEYAKYTPNEYLSEEQKKMKSDDNYKAVLDNEADEEEKIFPISEDMQEYIKILEKVNVMCRSKTSKKQNCFTDNTRLHKIEDLTQHTPFSKIYDGNLTNIYGKKDLDDLPQDLFIVSTHVDTVNNISKCSSKYDGNTGNLRGTYDNAGTNAACVIAMRKFDLPDNVIFAFNGDEETGKCKGAEEVLTVMKEHNKKIFPIALDVTYDSYDDKKLYTIENFYGNIKTAELVINRARDLDSNLDNPTFTYVKAPNGPLPKLDKNEVSRDRSWFDEGAYYGEKRISAFSLCLPCGEGEMHSNYGVQVKAPVFEGYVNSLVGMLYEITKDKSNELEDIANQKNFNDERVLVYCQPILDTKLNKFTTAESLMRLKLDGLGIIYPDVFIPLAEKNNNIHILTCIILNKVCKFIEKNPDITRISVNFSMYEITNPKFYHDIYNIISKYHFDLNKLGFEITETVEANDFDIINDTLQRFRNLGIKIYLDDFGTGYSNIEHITKIPIDIIKFDRSLVISSGQSEKSKYIVSNMSDIFYNTNYNILYEGIEDNNDEHRCMGMNAEYLQGYKYSRPIPIEELSKFINQQPQN